MLHIRVGQARQTPFICFKFHFWKKYQGMYVFLHNNSHFNLTVCFQNWSLQLHMVTCLVMGQGPSRAWHFEKGLCLIQARAWLFEKGLENWSFYGVKIIGPSRLGLDFFRKVWALAWPEPDIQSPGLARARLFRAQPITNTNRNTIAFWFVIVLVFFGVVEKHHPIQTSRALPLLRFWRLIPVKLEDGVGSSLF